MIQRTHGEITEKLCEIFPDAETREYERLDGGVIRLVLHSEYSAPGLTLDDLMNLAEFFGTRKIDRTEEIVRPGCETCDYGSRYGFELTVKETP